MFCIPTNASEEYVEIHSVQEIVMEPMNAVENSKGATDNAKQPTYAGEELVTETNTVQEVVMEPDYVTEDSE